MSAQPMFPNPNPRTLVRPVTLNRRQLCGVAAGGVLGGGTFLVRSASTEAAFFSAVGRLLSEFVLAVGVEAIWQLAPRFVDWASNLWDDEREAVERVNASAAGHGFSHCSHSPVYGNSFDPLALYVVDDDAGLNGCVPILAGGIYFPATAMIHGPAVAGITWAAQEWDYPSGLPAYCALLPIQDLVPDTAHWFQHSSDEAYVARTLVGEIECFYHAEPDYQEGEVSVVSRVDNGQEVFNRSYPLNWGR